MNVYLFQTGFILSWISHDISREFEADFELWANNWKHKGRNERNLHKDQNKHLSIPSSKKILMATDLKYIFKILFLLYIKILARSAAQDLWNMWAVRNLKMRNSLFDFPVLKTCLHKELKETKRWKFSLSMKNSIFLIRVCSRKWSLILGNMCENMFLTIPWVVIFFPWDSDILFDEKSKYGHFLFFARLS